MLEASGRLKAHWQDYVAGLPLGSVIRLHPNEFVANSILACSAAVNCWRYLCWLPCSGTQRLLCVSVSVTVSLFSFFFLIHHSQMILNRLLFPLYSFAQLIQQQKLWGAVEDRINTLFLALGLVTRCEQRARLREEYEPILPRPARLLLSGWDTALLA